MSLFPLRSHPSHSSPSPPAGVTTPMTYFGMWRSFFGWHKEDADLLSINFLHWGAPKMWYCISPKDQAKFQRMAQVRAGCRCVRLGCQPWKSSLSNFPHFAPVICLLFTSCCKASSRPCHPP